MSPGGSAEKIKVATISKLVSYEEYECNSVHVTVSYADDVMKSYAGLSMHHRHLTYWDRTISMQ